MTDKKIETCFLPDRSRIDANVELTVVIDVLRASSVMVAALQNGAKSITTVRGIQQAKELHRSNDRMLLCGERDCEKIDGFHFGNSPSEYHPGCVQGRELVLTTTNGTAAIDASVAAQLIVVGCFLNLSAVVGRVAQARNVRLVCAGTNGRITAEDVLFAGAVVTTIRDVSNDPSEFVFNDESNLACQAWSASFGGHQPDIDSLARRLSQSHGGRDLDRLGYSDDVRFCSQIDLTSVVPTRIATSPNRFVIDEH